MEEMPEGFEVPVIDVNEIKTDFSKPTDPKPLSNEEAMKLMQYRSSLMQEVARKYSEFIECIYKLPIHIVFRQNAFTRLDEGHMWIEKGINNVWNLPVEKKNQAEEPLAEQCANPNESQQESLGAETVSEPQVVG